MILYFLTHKNLFFLTVTTASLRQPEPYITSSESTAGSLQGEGGEDYK
jgi:hypothetical protein